MNFNPFLFSWKNLALLVRGNKAFLFWIIFCFTAFLFLFSRSVTTLDPDLGWHLRVGKDIISQGRVLCTESYLYPILGKEWVDHEWLGNIFLYLIFSLSSSSYWFLSAIFSSLVLVCLVSLTWFCRVYLVPHAKSSSFLFFASLLQIPGLLIFNHFHGIRLQIFSWLFFTFCIILFLIFIEKRNPLSLLGLPLLFFLWANLHGSFILGLFFLTLFLLFSFVAIRKNLNHQKKLSMLAVWAACFLATLANPYGVKLWKLLLVDYTSNTYYARHISEWLPQYVSPFIWPAVFYLALFVFLVSFGFYFRILTKKDKILWFLFAISAIFLPLSVEYRRHLPLFFLVSYPLLLTFIIRLMPKFNLEKNLFVSFSVAVASLAVCTTAISKVAIGAFSDPFSAKVKDYPYGAVGFLKKNNQYHSLVFLNHYNWGGYLDWVWPEKKIFIDGRFPQMRLEGGNTYIEEFDAFFKKDSFKAQLEKYRIELVLWPQKDNTRLPWLDRYLAENIFFLKKNEPASSDFLKSYLNHNWKKIYSDETSLIYLNPFFPENLPPGNAN